jgi:hypothetical protein
MGIIPQTPNSIMYVCNHASLIFEFTSMRFAFLKIYVAALNHYCTKYHDHDDNYDNSGTVSHLPEAKEGIAVDQEDFRNTIPLPTSTVLSSKPAERCYRWCA